MQIKFPEKIISTDFENILKRYYYKSKFKKNQSIEFDFTNVTWFGIFGLSLISLWLQELLDMKKEIIVDFPSEKKVHDFLINYRFAEFLMKNEIKIENKTPFKSAKARSHLVKAPFYPLTFFDEEIFNRLLDDLMHGNRMEIIFEEIKDTEIVKSGVIRDIVLRELGNNIFYHSGRNIGNLIMTKYEASSVDSKEKWMHSLISRSSIYEENFFRKLKGESYLELIISDKGKGIFESLTQAYHDDNIISNKKEDPTEKDILEYSFLYHATRRNIMERIGNIKDVISPKTKKFPPPTGLFSLINIIREFHGLLYMRSGSSILCYDFYQGEVDNKPKIDDKTKFTPFGGTQFKLLFPLKIPRKKVTSTSSFNQLNLQDAEEKPLCAELIILKNYTKLKQLNSLDEQAKFLNDIFDEIEKRKHQSKERQSCLMLDGLKDIQLPSKAQHYLIYEAMNRQERNFAVLITNVDLKILSLQKDFVQSRNLLKRTLALFNERMEPYFLGLNENEKKIASNIIQRIVENEDKDINKFVIKNNHLFTYNKSENNYSFIYTCRRLNNLIKNGLKSEIRKIILENNSFIFHKNIKALIPSKHYCEGYFETYRLLADNTWRSIIVSYFKCILLETKPDFIISITGYCGAVIDEALKHLQEIGFDLKPIHLNFTTPIHGFDYAKIVFEIDKEKVGIVITDVIGTGETIKSILEQSYHIKITNIFSFVDAKDNQECYIKNRASNVPIDCILKQKLNYYTDLPPGWLYREIHNVDPETNILIHNPLKLSGPIWKEISISDETYKGKKIERKYNYFLNEVVYPIGAFECGHFSSKNQHLLYLFNIPKITNYFLKEITDIVVKNAEQYLSKIFPLKRITHIMYPSFNPGLKKIAYQISSKFQKSTPLAINYEEFISSYDQEEPKPFIEGALIIDDAIVSGESIYRFLDIAERKGAKLIYVCVLIKRGSDYSTRKLEKTIQYGRSRVFFQYLSEVQLPVYSSTNCPVCYRIKELSKLTELLKDYDNLKDLVAFINIKLSKLSLRNIEEVIEESLLTSEKLQIEHTNTKLNFRWKLELARTHLGVRNELATITSDFENSSQNVLALFNVIGKEKLYLLLNDKIRKSIFYDTFRENIISACKFYIQNLEIISEEDLESIIDILKVFDPNVFIDKLSSLFDLKKLDQEKFFQLCIQILLSQKAHEYPSRIINVLKILLETTKENKVSHTITTTSIGLLSYWEFLEKKLTKLRQNNLEIFKELEGSNFHNVRQALDSLSSDINTEQLYTKKIILNWEHLHLALKEDLEKLRIFIGINKRYDLVSKIEEHINRLDIQLERGQKIVLKLSDRGPNELNHEEIISVRGALNNFIKRIDTLIWEKEGIKVSLKNYRTNIKTIIHKVLEQYSDRLSSKNIKVVREYDEDLCFVFGDEYNILRVCQNLIENVWKHSDASLLKIFLEIDNHKECVRLEVLDNGKGFSEPLIFLEGLKIVQDIINFYNGLFEIKTIDTTKNPSLFKYTSLTKATIELPLIKQFISEVR